VKVKEIKNVKDVEGDRSSNAIITSLKKLPTLPRPHNLPF
jgi:hypothetical protein